MIATYTGSGLDFDHYDLVKHKWKANLSYISSLHFLHYLLAIGTTILYLLMLMSVVVGGCIIVSKGFFHGYRSVDIRVFVKPEIYKSLRDAK